MEKLRDRIIQYGKKAGFEAVRFCTAEPLSEWGEELEKRKKLDPATSDNWRERNLSKDPLKYLEDAKTIVVAVFSYTPYKQEFPEGIGAYSPHYPAYQKGREAVKELAAKIEEEGYKAVTEHRLPVKALALKSGAGCYGKNGLIHLKGHGSFITLHAIITNADIPFDDSKDIITDCGSCRTCMDACPMGAISDNGAVLQSRCIRYYMFTSNFIPVEIRENAGVKMLGCDRCQVCCPMNHRKMKSAANPPMEEMQLFDIKSILEEGMTGLKERAERIGELVGHNYARPMRILSTAIIAAGNSGDPGYIPLLKQLLYHPDDNIRKYSSWALGKME